MRTTVLVASLFLSTAFSQEDAVTPETLGDGSLKYKFIVLTDLDKASKHPEKPYVWLSYKTAGWLTLTGKDTESPSAKIDWEKGVEVELDSGYSYHGRGMELSDASRFYGALLTVDDRSGIVFRISGDKVFPWVILADGDGNRTKGFKGEWMTVKDGELYVGGYGNPWISKDGKQPPGMDPMWVKKIGEGGSVESLNWTDNFFAIQKALNVSFPKGYVIHESCQWSDFHEKWFFMPRGVSQDNHDFDKDGWRGANYLVAANEDFSDISVQELGRKNLTRGFSAFQFLPGTDDQFVVALKTTELDNKALGTYISVYQLEGGKVLVNEEELPHKHKYEAIAFV